jgi:hypothetical protein
MGCHGIRVTDPEQIASAIAEGLANDADGSRSCGYARSRQDSSSSRQPDALGQPSPCRSGRALLRGLTDVEISQAIATPGRSSIGLPGFAIQHLRTASETAVVEIARAERAGRLHDRTDRRARNAFCVSLAAVALAALALIVSFLAWRYPSR